MDPAFILHFGCLLCYLDLSGRLSFALFAFARAFLRLKLFELCLVLDQVIVLLKRVFVQVFEVLFNVDWVFIKVGDDFLQEFESFLELGVVGFDLLLVFFKLELDVLDQFAEILVVEYKS